VVGSTAYATVDGFDTFVPESRGLLRYEMRGHVAVRSDDAPPRDIVETRCEERADRARSTRISSLRRDPTVRVRVSGRESLEDGAHRALEVVHEGQRRERATRDAGPAADVRRGDRRPGMLIEM
jgi:hypothetical protein